MGRAKPCNYITGDTYNVAKYGANGRMIWNRYLGSQGEIAVSPVASRVFVGGGGDGNVYCLDAHSGTTLWTYETITNPTRGLDADYEGGVVFSDYVFNPLNGLNRIKRLDKTGAASWTYQPIGSLSGTVQPIDIRVSENEVWWCDRATFGVLDTDGNEIEASQNQGWKDTSYSFNDWIGLFACHPTEKLIIANLSDVSYRTLRNSAPAHSEDLASVTSYFGLGVAGVDRPPFTPFVFLGDVTTGPTKFDTFMLWNNQSGYVPGVYLRQKPNFTTIGAFTQKTTTGTLGTRLDRWLDGIVAVGTGMTVSGEPCEIFTMDADGNIPWVKRWTLAGVTRTMSCVCSDRNGCVYVTGAAADGDVP